MQPLMYLVHFRLIGVTTIQRDETKMDTERRLTAQIESERLIETRKRAYINEIKDTVCACFFIVRIGTRVKMHLD